MSNEEYASMYRNNCSCCGNYIPNFNHYPNTLSHVVESEGNHCVTCYREMAELSHKAHAKALQHIEQHIHRDNLQAFINMPRRMKYRFVNFLNHAGYAEWTFNSPTLPYYKLNFE